jgi:hypothetical protein
VTAGGATAPPSPTPLMPTSAIVGDHKETVHQGFPITVSPSAHLRGSLQTDRACHPIAVLSATVAAGSSLSWSPLVTASASAAMQMQRSQGAATACHVNDPSGDLVHRSPAERCRVEPPERVDHADPLASAAATMTSTLGDNRETRAASQLRTCTLLNSAADTMCTIANRSLDAS